METFTANDMASAIRGATGIPVNYRALGILLDRMGVLANRRDYRRLMAVLQDILPEWAEAADSIAEQPNQAIQPIYVSVSARGVRRK